MMRGWGGGLNCLPLESSLLLLKQRNVQGTGVSCSNAVSGAPCLRRGCHPSVLEKSEAQGK